MAVDPEQTNRRSTLGGMCCPTCSAPVRADFAFCGRCGADLAPPAPAPAYPPPAPAPAYQPPAPAPAYQPPAPAYPPPAARSYPPGPNGSTGRALLAQFILWGGLLLVLVLITQTQYLGQPAMSILWQRAMIIDAHSGEAGLRLGAQPGSRVLLLVLLVLPYLLAAAIAAGSTARWARAAVAAVAAASIQYIFWYSASHAVWVMSVAVVLILFAGWLGMRARPVAAYGLLAPVTGVAVLFYVPKGPGPWLQDVPARVHTSSNYAWFAWGLLVVFAVSGLIGLLAAVLPSTRGALGATRTAWASLGALLVAAAIAGAVTQSAFLPKPLTTADGDGSVAVSDGISADQARSTADDAFSAMSGTGSVDTCGASLPTLPIDNYTIDEVTPQTQGTFWVTADVTLDDGTTEQVSVLIGTGSDGSPCVANQSVENVHSAPAPSAAPTGSSGPTEPADVPSVPSAGDPVPTDAALPGPPDDSTVVPYTDGTDTPTTSDELVEYEPDGLTPDEQAAVADVISFMTHINQQDFAAAWNDSTDSLTGSAPTTAFDRGYATSRFYQVAFGQPKQLAGDLIVIPARFASRQDPAAQGNPPGVTDCSYWPQYVFVVGEVNGRWLDDVAGKFASRSALTPLKRAGSDGRYLNPIAQRVAC